MNKIMLKLSYLKHYYRQKTLRQIDWSHPSNADCNYNTKIQNSLSIWISSLTTSELRYIKDFERQKSFILNSNTVKLKQQSEQLKRQFVKVEYHGGGWYTFSPTRHKYYNCTDEIKIQGLSSLITELNKHNLWSSIGSNIIGFN